MLHVLLILQSNKKSVPESEAPHVGYRLVPNSMPGLDSRRGDLKNQGLLRFLNLNPDHPLYNPERKSVIGNKPDSIVSIAQCPPASTFYLGYFKEETALAREITECSLIRSKCYSLKTRDRKNPTLVLTINRCKGVKKRRVAALPYEAYKSVLKKLDSVNGEQVVIRSHRNKMFTMNLRKRFFSSFDDKTYLL